MADRQRLPLTFGQGLDRATGIAAVDPTSFTDLRNVELFSGIAQARKGMARTATLISGVVPLPMERIVFIAPLKGVRRGAVMGQRASSALLQLFLTDPLGNTPQLTTPNYAAFAGPMVMHAAEVYRKLFIAHDAAPASRGPTVYYDEDTGISNVPLTANLDGLGVAPIRFRGVVRHLNYLVGWGFGTNNSGDRPEILRISLPGEPTVFNPEHYFLVGARGDPIVACVPLGTELLVFKESEFHAIVGSNRANFGLVPRDTAFGLAGSKLAVTVAGVCYFWSPQGPRATAGGPSAEIAIPLNLEAPEPADLVASGAIATGFAVYVPATRQIKFVFGRRAYVLNLRDPSNPRWTYDEFGVEVSCGGDFYGLGDTPGSSRITTFYGMGQGPGLLQANSGFLDDTQVYAVLAKTDPAAPAGPSGECVFPAIWLTVTHTMGIRLRLTPFVDGVARDPKDVVLVASGPRVSEVKEVGFHEPYVDGAGEQSKFYLRGTWFSLEIRTFVDADNPGIGTGDLLLEQVAVEWEAVQETRIPL